jgi:hypothetical protein
MSLSAPSSFLTLAPGSSLIIQLHNGFFVLTTGRMTMTVPAHGQIRIGTANAEGFRQFDHEPVGTPNDWLVEALERSVAKS